MNSSLYCDLGTISNFKLNFKLKYYFEGTILFFKWYLTFDLYIFQKRGMEGPHYEGRGSTWPAQHELTVSIML